MVSQFSDQITKLCFTAIVMPFTLKEVKLRVMEYYKSSQFLVKVELELDFKFCLDPETFSAEFVFKNSFAK